MIFPQHGEVFLFLWSGFNYKIFPLLLIFFGQNAYDLRSLKETKKNKTIDDITDSRPITIYERHP
jgi:hypothetical protein